LNLKKISKWIFFESLTVVRAKLEIFLQPDSSQGFLAITQTGAEQISLIISLPTPNQLKRKALLCLKANRDIDITNANAVQELIFVEIVKSVFENISFISQVTSPLSIKPANFEFRRPICQF
jgi:hypothetical protein